MKKTFLICLLLIAVVHAAKSQAITITGTVKTEQGKPVSLAFLYDKKLRNATYSDSLGNFTLPVNTASKLLVRCKSFADAVISIGNKTDFQIVLKSTGAAGGGSSGAAERERDALANENKLSNAFSPRGSVTGDNDYSFTEGATFAGHKKGNVHGSRYLFEKWVQGYVISPLDSMFQDPGSLFNYDKIGGGLLYTRDEKTVKQINRDQIKSFKLFDGGDTPYSFESVPAIDNTHYLQVLASGKKYAIYKLIKTDFVKSDYTTNGFTTHGNDYDEYVDHGSYYVLDVQSNQVKLLLLKKKSIKEAFAADANKLSKFMAASTGDIDDAYLSSLGAFIN